MTAIFTILAAAVIIVVLAGGWFIFTYNQFVRLKNKTEEAYAALEVSLKKRYDLLPNLVETVKGYAKHEADTLEKVIGARSKAVKAESLQERMKDERVLSGTLRSLFVLSENYPELKANGSFLEFQEQLSRIEEEIAGSRRYYNAVVSRFNTRLEMFPGNIIGSMLGFRHRPLYETADEGEKENVKISFFQGTDI